MNLDIDDGTKFPDLVKAKLGKTLQDLVKGLVTKDKEFFEYAQETKKKLRKQKETDLKSFILSQSGAIDRGNQNSCGTKDKFDNLAKDLGAVTPIIIPSTKREAFQGIGKMKTDYPKTTGAVPTNGEKSRPLSIANFPVNQGIAPTTSNTKYAVQQVTTDNSQVKSQRNLTQFTRAHSGLRGTSIGDRAVVFSSNGTPLYGDSYLDKNLTENLAANQAIAHQPLSQIPKQLETTKPISAAPLQQQPRANVTPKSDSVANMAVLGGIAAAVTAVLFFFQYVLMFVQFILQVSSVTSTITNIASSFVAIMNNTGALLGLGEGVLDPLEKTFDSILNSTFGKDKVDYVKYQFAKISAAYVAGKNILDKFSSSQNTVGKVLEKNANNTSKIGNALKMVGMISDSEGWMSENNKVNEAATGFKSKIENISGLASTLTDITTEVKTAKEQLETLDKDREASQKDEKDNTDKAVDKHSDKDVPEARALQEPAS